MKVKKKKKEENFPIDYQRKNVRKWMLITNEMNIKIFLIYKKKSLNFSQKKKGEKKRKEKKRKYEEHLVTFLPFGVFDYPNANGVDLGVCVCDVCIHNSSSSEPNVLWNRNKTKKNLIT